MGPEDSRPATPLHRSSIHPNPQVQGTCSAVNPHLEAGKAASHTWIAVASLMTRSWVTSLHPTHNLSVSVPTPNAQHAKLAQLVEQFGPDNRSWQRIAALIPGCVRLAKAEAWAIDRDSVLGSFYLYCLANGLYMPAAHLPAVSHRTPGLIRSPGHSYHTPCHCLRAARRRNGKQCRERWLNHLRWGAPSLGQGWPY
jgi:hypothetical protein